MEPLLTGYLLHALTEREQSEAEAYLAQHPEAHETLAQLKAALEPLALDKDAPTPPPNLIERTLARVAEHICTEKATPSELPTAPVVRSHSIAARAWWRRMDVLVAACLLVTVLGVGLITLGRLRGPTSAGMMAECKNNLRQFSNALQTYRDLHGRFPDVSKEAPRNVAGMVVPILSDAGMLPTGASIRCPGLGSPLTNQSNLGALRAMSEDEFKQLSPSLSMCYAYSLGYRDAVGGIHAPADVPNDGKSQTPLMADRPPAEGVLTNSINHAGSGQNVLFADGSVQFLPIRTRADDDIFLNRDKRVAAGIDALDAVLGYSGARQ
jgi:prepilin-type processing-associated H-X9-DG protein